MLVSLASEVRVKELAPWLLIETFPNVPPDVFLLYNTTLPRLIAIELTVTLPGAPAMAEVTPHDVLVPVMTDNFEKSVGFKEDIVVVAIEGDVEVSLEIELKADDPLPDTSFAASVVIEQLLKLTCAGNVTFKLEDVDDKNLQKEKVASDVPIKDKNAFIFSELL